MVGIGKRSVTILAIAALLGTAVAAAATLGGHAPASAQTSGPGRARTTASVPAPSAPAIIGLSKPLVILYGDSLAWEAQDAFVNAFAGMPGVQVLTRTYGGTAICDWFDIMEADVQNIRPTAVLIEFAGNPGPSCVGGQDPLTKYREDAQHVVGIFNSQGIHTYFVSPPKQVPVGGTTTESPDPWREMYFQVALDNSTRFADAGHSVYNFGVGAWTFTLPCNSPTEPGCTNGSVQVRDPSDGLHFCPDRMGGPLVDCPGYGGYVPGAFRYGTSMAAIVASQLGF